MFVKVEIISIFVVKRGDVGLPRRNLSYFFCGFDCDHGKYR